VCCIAQVDGVVLEADTSKGLRFGTGDIGRWDIFADNHAKDGPKIVAYAVRRPEYEKVVSLRPFSDTTLLILASIFDRPYSVHAIGRADPLWQLRFYEVDLKRATVYLDDGERVTERGVSDHDAQRSEKKGELRKFHFPGDISYQSE
jgi:hypothetical protein